uniref:Uncharacterized protein n=1 Tax=Neogobius melanostomus TaxID=47308 RepID=A0A8C6S8G1_9GOBI
MLANTEKIKEKNILKGTMTSQALSRRSVFTVPAFQALGSHGNSAVEVDRDTVERMARIQASFKGNKDGVLSELLKRVCDIHPELHANYRVQG